MDKEIKDIHKCREMFEFFKRYKSIDPSLSYSDINTEIELECFRDKEIRTYKGETNNHLIYLNCIKPYIRGRTALEIGPGRGTITKSLLDASSIDCMDIIPPEEVGFYDYVGKHDHVKYHQVDNFSCDCLEDDSYDYFISIGTFNHISLEGHDKYLCNLYQKFKKDFIGFLMVTDPFVYQKKSNSFKDLVYMSRRASRRIEDYEKSNHRAGQWRYIGLEKVCNLLRKYNYRILSEDVDCHNRDPIIQFTK
jgi:hypothetical protein